MHYLLRGMIEPGAELYSPCKEAYAMLKEAVVGGQSAVFKRYHEAGVTRIRPHCFTNQKFASELLATTPTFSICRPYVERNALREGKVICYRNPEGAVPMPTELVKNGTWFGFNRSGPRNTESSTVEV